MTRSSLYPKLPGPANKQENFNKALKWAIRQSVREATRSAVTQDNLETLQLQQQQIIRQQLTQQIWLHQDIQPDHCIHCGIGPLAPDANGKADCCAMCR